MRLISILIKLLLVAMPIAHAQQTGISPTAGTAGAQGNVNRVRVD